MRRSRHSCTSGTGWRPAVADRDRLDHDPFGLYRPDADPDEETGEHSTALRLAAAVSVLVLLAATLAAGPAGLLVAVSVLAGVAALVLVLRVPAPPRSRRSARPGLAVDNAPFRAYREVAEQLSWAAVSRRHYDLATRPLLTRLAAYRLADRHRVDLYADPDAARALVGEDVWPWVDPAREPSRDSQPPGVPRETLTRIIDRLEHL